MQDRFFNRGTIAGGESQTGGEHVDPLIDEITSEDILDRISETNDGDITDVGEMETSIPLEVPHNVNVRLSKSQQHLALGKGVTNAGMSTFVLPDKEGQLAGFWVDDPGILVAQFPQYKFAQIKGEEVPSIRI